MATVEAAIRLGVDQRIADEEVIRRVLEGEIELFEIIMRRYNHKDRMKGRSLRMCQV